MSKHLFVRVAFISVTSTVALALHGCGNPASGPPEPAQDGGFQTTGSAGSSGCVTGGEFACAAGGAPEAGGSPGIGGGPEPGGATGMGGAAGTPSCSTELDFPGSTIELCSGSCPVNIPVSSFSPCKMVGCTAAHCVPKSAVPASVPLELLAECDDTTTVCIPDDYTASFGKFLAKSCTSLLGAEGRCISTCIPQVNGLMDVLPKDVCGDNERCAPCINPNDGTETGACSQGCDPGESQDTKDHPIVFEKCANGGGVCAPKSIIPQDLTGELTQMTCPSTDQVCAPIQKTQNLKYNFPECTPSNAFVLALATPGMNGQLGGCVPEWLADSNLLQGIFMAQDTCKTGEKCAPCNNPLHLDAPTGACPVPLPSDPHGGMPPDGGVPHATGGAGGMGGAAGASGAQGAGGSTGAGGASGTVGAGGAP
jgi:hypothetical protein